MTYGLKIALKTSLATYKKQMVELVNVVKKLPRPEEEDENDEQLTKKGKRGFLRFPLWDLSW